MISVYEKKHEPLLSRKEFIARLLAHLFLGLGLIAVSLGLGVLGYHFVVGLPWMDAMLDAAMILTGMGPISHPTTSGGKLFATFYALFSGIIFISTVGVMLAPAIHRFFHKFHVK